MPRLHPATRRRYRPLSVLTGLCGMVMAGLAPMMAKAGPPQRVVSLNLCTDQMLLALLPRERIAGLSHLAGDDAYSPLIDRVGDIPLLQGMAEEVLPLRPDLVLVGVYTTRPTVALLRARGIPVREMAQPHDFDGIRTQIRDLAQLLDATARGEELIAEMDAALANAIAPARPGARPIRVLSLAPGAFTAGAGTLYDAAMRAAGLVNYAADKGLVGYGYLAVEDVVADPPDLMLANADEKGHPSLNGQLLAHPALAHAIPPDRRPSIPGRLWTCGGPFTAQAVARLAAARDQLSPISETAP